MTTELTVRPLAECEAVIERGLRTFVEVGQALLEIRDGRLYKETHGSFEDYCNQRWGFSDRRASQMIQAAGVSKILGTSDLPAPTTDSVARALAPLTDEPEQVEEVWGEVVQEHGPKPTAAQVRDAVQERTTPPGVRKQGAQQRLLKGITEKARHIEELMPAADFDAIKSLPPAEREQWKQQLSATRTVLSRLIGALS